jgi:hypothetical protein
MKKTLFLSALSLLGLLSACSTGPVDDNKTAECSQIMGRVIQAPAAQQTTRGNFLTQYRQQMNEEAARTHARKAGCLK